MTTYFGMHINLTFIHDLCYVSYYFEVIKDSKGQQKVKKGHFFNYLKMTEKLVNILFKGKISTTITFFIKKTKIWPYFF